MSSNRRGAAGLGQGKEGFKMGFSGLGRAVKKFFGYFPVLAPVAVVCILVAAGVNAIPPLFTQKIITVIENTFEGGDWAGARPEVVRYGIHDTGFPRQAPKRDVRGNAAPANKVFRYA